MIRSRKRRRRSNRCFACGEGCSMQGMLVLIVVVMFFLVAYSANSASDVEFDVARSLSTINDTTDTSKYHESSSSNPAKTTTKNTNAVTLKSQERPSFLRDKAAGFHAIHVYHGPEDSINSLPNNSEGMVYKQYGRGSQVDQDRIVAALALALASQVAAAAEEEPSFYFVDLAANDPIQLSNTLLLEKKGWHGLCVEPNPMYWYRLAHRQCDVAAAFVGSRQDQNKVTVSLTNKEFGGIVGDGMDNKDHSKVETEQRYTISLKSIFDDFGVPKSIDYLSLDVEGAEELIMRDFPYESYTIHFLTVERPKPELQTILKSNGYQFVMMLIYWGETLWVHESVAKQMGVDKIQEVAKANSDYVDKTPKKGQHLFTIDTGEYKRVV
ncbi:unnamed protein product [Cylindrotheca closterium]|uniref:Methyltransferase FkbM domain-containing protein n=1 Tax=Cylindrotheca closterium TaxID=2856 RepID=A0AAD2JMI9_9STRA|nr:unnamed protein product [Cylindrotheca closterium]